MNISSNAESAETAEKMYMKVSAGSAISACRRPARQILSGNTLKRSVAITAMLCVGVVAAAAAQDAKVTKGQQLFTEQCLLCHSIGDRRNKKRAAGRCRR
jgi:mono/diheme cytochrome c family protein